MPFNNEVSLVYSENRSKTHLEAIACPRKASEGALSKISLMMHALDSSMSTVLEAGDDRPLL